MISDKLAAAIHEEIANLEDEIEQIEQRIAGLKVHLPEQQGVLSEKFDPLARHVPKVRTTRRRKAATPKKARTPSANETREQAVLRIVRARKNVTVKQIADEMGLKDATGLYRVVNRLVRVGHLVKSGRTLALAPSDDYV